MSSILEIYEDVKKIKDVIDNPKNAIESSEAAESIAQVRKDIKEIKQSLKVAQVGVRHKEPALTGQLAHSNKIQKRTVEVLERIDSRQSKEGKRSFKTSIITFSIMAVLAYGSIHLELFDKQEVKQILVYGFDYLFGLSI